MTLPFCWLAISFTLGSLISHYLPQLAAFFFIPGFFLLPALVFLRGRKIFEPLLLVLLFLLGAGFGHFDRTKPTPGLEKIVPTLAEERPVVLWGKVATEPEVKTKGRKVTASFVLESSKINRRKTDGRVQIFLFQPKVFPEIGDEVRLWGKINAVPAALNPGQFNYRHYLKERDIGFILNVYGGGSMRLMREGPAWDFRRLLARTRKAIGARIETLFPEKDRVFIKALILGERKNMSPEWKNDFLKTGTSHLLAISGLNIALAVGSFYMLVIAVGIPQKPAALLAFFATIFQVFIAGLGIPVQRAGIMACFGFLALLLERERNGLNLFFLAFLVLLVLDTRSLFNISFQLSFLSLFFLILFAHYWKGRWPWLEALAGSAAVMAGTLPIVVYHFNTFAPISIFANLLAIPFFHLTLFMALIGLVLGGIPFLGTLPIFLSHFFLKLGLMWIHFCAQPQWGYYFLLKPPVFHMFLYYGALGLVFALKRPKLRYAALGIWLLSFIFLFRPAHQPGFELTVFAAGSNELMHVQFADGSHWLINAGRSKPSSQAEWIVAPYLRSKGIKKLKGILFTDYLKRHTAGFEMLQRNFAFEYAVGPFLYKGMQDLPTQRIIQMRKGNRILIPDGSVIEILDHYQGRFILGITHGDIRFVIFPYLRPGLMEKLVRETDVIVLPARGGDKKQFGKISVKQMVMPQDLMTQGAVLFRILDKKDLTIKSFLAISDKG